LNTNAKCGIANNDDSKTQITTENVLDINYFFSPVTRDV
jgi:hypothetical protein